MLSKEQILECSDIVTETVPVPEWGGDVLVATISGRERDRFEQEVVNIGKGRVVENLRARLVARCIVDGEGKRMFADSDVVKLGKKSAKALDRIFSVCQKMNGFTESDIEELEKNSESGQSGDSASA